MANRVTLGELKARVLDRADMSKSGFIETARLVDYINASRSELHDLLVTTHEDYFQKSQSITLVSNQESYDLPDDYYKTLKMYFLRGGTDRIPIRRFSLEDLDLDNFSATVLSIDARFLKYRILGDKVYFTPKPGSADRIEHWYIYQAGKFDPNEDSQEIDYSVPVGWDEYIVVDAAIQCLIKEESDVAALMAKKAEIKERILAAAPNRDVGEPDRVIDVSGRARPWWEYV